MKRLSVVAGGIEEWSADDVAEEILDLSRVALERADMDPDAFYERGGRKALEEKVAKAIDRHWGKDAMASLLVKLIVYGDFVS